MSLLIGTKGRVRSVEGLGLSGIRSLTVAALIEVAARNRALRAGDPLPAIRAHRSAQKEGRL